MSEWEPYINDRLVLRFDDLKLYVIKPNDDEVCAPVCCTVCEMMMSTPLDEETWKRFGCCERCANEWAYKRAKEWEDGWRPTEQEIKQRLAS